MCEQDLTLFHTSSPSDMKYVIPFLLLLPFLVNAQNPNTGSGNASDTTKIPSKIILVPYQPMMHFSDADPDISRFSKMGEPQVRNELRNQLELNTYHQLLSAFDVVSLLRATSLDGEKDLNRIYAATRYTSYAKRDKEEYLKSKGKEEKPGVKSLLEKFSKKSKDQTFWVSDSSVMLGMIMDKELFSYLHKKYNETYILFITQFEIYTSNKNTIEWLKQSYTREYTIHYNLFDKSGVLIRAEVLTIKAGPENTLKEISEKYLRQIASHLKTIIVTSEQ